ncbi:FecCD family ABC transporter permease [Bacillus sp. FJAT-44742]|uniref:FecCD family ABC transporter permease n=1 Tax=Bacillus sp. FJAT-44742 TaxID=2014005 RepID=UPI000C233A5E|nr:iron ABC transporter permease [Bacillus sp. FJAT-44742]
MNRKFLRKVSFTYKLIVSLILLIGMFTVSLLMGAAEITAYDVWLALISDIRNEQVLLIQEIRLPREIGALFTGAALAVAGGVMQGLTRNPLADPGLLGLTAGANAGLAVTMAFFPGINYFGIMIACFIGAAAGAAMVFGIGAVKKGGYSPFRIVLAGAAISAFLFALAEGVGIYFRISQDISMWTAGGLIGTTWGQLQLIVPFITFGIVLSILLSRQLTVLSLHEELAVGLGQRTMQVKVLLFIIIIILAGSSVALVGNLAFLGLMIPHIVRWMVGTDYRFIIPMSAIMGGAFMLFADTAGRVIHAPYETPAAAIVAIIGLPFFLLIVRKGGNRFS